MSAVAGLMAKSTSPSATISTIPRASAGISCTSMPGCSRWNRRIVGPTSMGSGTLAGMQATRTVP